MKMEEEHVDINTVVDSSKQFRYEVADGGGKDEDIVWAEDDSEDHEPFVLKTLMVQPEEDVYRR